MALLYFVETVQNCGFVVTSAVYAFRSDTTLGIYASAIRYVADAHSAELFVRWSELCAILCGVVDMHCLKKLHFVSLHNSWKN